MDGVGESDGIIKEIDHSLPLSLPVMILRLP